MEGLPSGCVMTSSSSSAAVQECHWSGVRAQCTGMREDLSAHRGVRLGGAVGPDQSRQPVKFTSELLQGDQWTGLQPLEGAFLPSCISAVKESRQMTQPIQRGVEERDALRQLTRTRNTQRRITSSEARTGLVSADRRQIRSST